MRYSERMIILSEWYTWNTYFDDNSRILEYKLLLLCRYMKSSKQLLEKAQSSSSSDFLVFKCFVNFANDIAFVFFLFPKPNYKQQCNDCMHWIDSKEAFNLWNKLYNLLGNRNVDFSHSGHRKKKNGKYKNLENLPTWLISLWGILSISVSQLQLQ